MNTIKRLLQTFCPEGVEYKKLGNVCEVLTGGEAPEDSIKTKKPEGDYIYPIYSNGIGDKAIWGYAKNYRIDKEAVTFSSIGTIGCPTIRKAKFTPIIRLKVIIPKDESTTNVRFIKYALEIAQFDKNKSSVPNINANMLKAITIPVPPITIQHKIVEILDNFTDLEAELEAELEARKKQYTYYRDQLLSFKDDKTVEWKTLGELGTFIRGNGLQKKDFTKEGFPCIHYGQIHTSYSTFTNKTISYTSEEYAKKLRKAEYGDLLIATTSEDVEGCCKAVAWLGNSQCAISGDAYIYHHNQNPKYIAYLFQTKMFLNQKKVAATGTKVVRVSGDAMAKFKFPIPSIAKQKEIVSILDRFESLVNDISSGLPAEIKARHQQYEYYRNQLLTFKRKA